MKLPLNRRLIRYSNKFRVRRGSNKFSQVQPKLHRTVNGILSLADVVSYFKELNLVKEIDIPFIANMQNEEMRTMFNIVPKKQYGFLLGTYKEKTNKMKNLMMIESDAIDDSLFNVIGNEKLVSLS